MADAGEGKRAIIRVPGIAMLAVALLLVCVTPAAFAGPGLLALYVIPLGLAVWIARTRTVATARGITVRTVLRKREFSWDEIKGLSLTSRSKVHAVLTDGTTVPLPTVRTRHVPVLSLVSEGRLPDPSGVLDENPS